jgi:hypothetical protein
LGARAALQDCGRRRKQAEWRLGRQARPYKGGLDAIAWSFHPLTPRDSTKMWYCGLCSVRRALEERWKAVSTRPCGGVRKLEDVDEAFATGSWTQFARLASTYGVGSNGVSHPYNMSEIAMERSHGGTRSGCSVVAAAGSAATLTRCAARAAVVEQQNEEDGVDGGGSVCMERRQVQSKQAPLFSPVGPSWAKLMRCPRDGVCLAAGFAPWYCSNGGRESRLRRSVWHD